MVVRPVRGPRRLVRRAWTALRLGAAAVAGAGLRLARRLRGLPPRIWHGMYPLHAVHAAVQADRQAGYPSRSVVRNSQLAGYALVTPAEFDRVVEHEGVPWDEWNWVCLEDLLLRGDIWVAFFECLFLAAERRRANRLVLRLLRLLGVRIVVWPHGGDVNHRQRFRDRFDALGRLQRDYPDWDLVAFAAVARARIEAFCAQADLVIASDPFLRRYLPRCDLLFKPLAVDCVALQPARDEDAEGAVDPLRTVRVVHAPNHRFVKGTDALVDAVARLQRRGLPIELRLVEREARADALRLYAEADVVADQFCVGSFGVFALEGLALGKPVLTYLDQEHLGDPVFNLPLVNTHVDNLEAVLGVVAQVRELRQRLGRAGRESVARYHGLDAQAQVWDRIYRHVWRGEPLDLEATAHFAPERRPRSFCEEPARQDFWPVPVADLLPQIRAALRPQS